MPAGRPKTIAAAHRSKQLQNYYNKRYGGESPKSISTLSSADYARTAEEKRQARKKDLEAFLAYRLTQVAGRAKHFNIPCSLTLEWLNNQPRVCAVTGASFVVLSKGKGPLTPSFDRIDPAGGYTPENTRLVACWVNMAKSNWPDEQIKQLIIEAAAHISHCR